MNEVHENLFKLLLELDTICNEHGIDYFLSGGTALGAVRNQCFLPWDDDIDLYISRENWYRLYDIISSNPDILPENRDLVCIENDKYHRNPIIRYVDTTTTRIYPSQATSAKTCGDQIEFFILDPIPNIGDGQEEHLRGMDVFFEVLSPYFIVSRFLSLDEFVIHSDLVEKCYEKMDEEGYLTVLHELYDKYFTFPIEKTDTLRLRWGMRNGIYDKSFYSKKRYELLEGHKFPIANMIEHALRIDYGDTWMYIPQITGQISHNPLIEDTNRSFKEFSDIYLRFVDQDKVTHAYEMNKRNNMGLWISRREIELQKEELAGIIARKEIDKVIEINNYDLNQLLEDRNYDVLDQIFDRFYSIQLNQNCKKYDFLIELDEDILKIAILNKIHQGFYHVANSIISIVESNMELSDDLKHYRVICEFCRNLSIAIYDTHNLETVGDLLKNVPEGCDDLIDTFRATLYFKLKTAKNHDDYESVIKEGKEMLEAYPTDGEIMSYIAEAYFNLDNLEKAKEIYDDAVHNTRNGFVWRRAKEQVGIDRMAEEEIYVVN